MSEVPAVRSWRTGRIMRAARILEIARAALDVEDGDDR